MLKIYTKNESRKLKLNEKNIIINPTKSVNTILAESIILSSSTVEVTNLGSTKLTSILTPVGANENIIWTSSDPSIISVNDNGLLTLVGSSGSVTITATTEKTKLSATCEAEVCIYPDSINNLQVENNKFASSSTISLYKPFGNVIIKNNTKEGKGIIAGISLLGELPDTLNEYDKNNPWCNITFKDNEGGFSGNVFDTNIPKRYSANKY